ncbi:hypothetical protein Dda_8537 [Drechslerella dactyloides]|uniref:Nephrocystin 3-like N-terminal domain-containing protein n=1 Tax=Drechslerella dactyloides TaxID=74499 RepID=A0AAD6NFY0_DREDA|nr:hypothetical protein Dda_8537 [Drechslerella dactyloides]
MSDSQAIRNAAVECRRSLEKCLDIPRLREGGWAENRLIDFGLWSEGAGVLAKGKLALDERLSTKLEVRNVIVKMLSLLNMFVESCQEKARESIDEVAHASDPKRERDDKTDEKEEHNFHETGLSHAEAEARKDVEETLNQIIRLTVAIRKAGSDSHLKRADRSFDKQNPKIQELRSLLELVIHPRGIKEEGLNEIQTRLIEANLRRRHRFTYAKVHSQKLARRDTEPRSKKEPFNSTIGAPVIKNLLQSENPLKPNLLLVDSNPRLELTDLPRPAPALTVTTAASAIEGTIILTEHKAPRAAATFYLSRIDWEDHIKTDHGQLWNCIVCDQLGDSTGHEFHQEKDIIQHLQTEHQDDVDTDEISMFVSASRSSKVTKTAGCPICPGPEDGQDTLEHIARCVHDFSLRSLPAPSEADGPEEYFDVGSRNNSSENVTSSLEGEERDFEGLPDLEFDSDHNTNAQHNQLTESSLKTIFHFFVPEDPRARLRAWISENNKVVGPGSGYINDSDFRRPLIAGDFDKRLRIPSSHPVDFDESIYNIGWVCTLPEEHHAGVAVLDRINTDEFVLNHNVYRLGAIGGHNVVMACFNATITGDIKRPSPLGSMLIEFPSIKIIFFVGVAGGIPPVSKVGATYTLQPTAQHPDIRLGDVVVGAPTEGHPPVAEINFDGKGDVTSYDVILEEIPLALRRDHYATYVHHLQTAPSITSEWFLQNLNFKVWLQGQERGQTLYCEGIPGAGKSYMMSRVIQYLLELHSTDENIGIAFAYCSLDSQEGQTPENLFATLLKQLLAQHPGLKEILSVSKSNLSVSQVFEELASAITKFSRVYILIDALDESDYCLERGYDFYLKLRELQDRTGVNAFLTSRFPLSTVASHGLESDDTHGAKPKNLAALISRTMLFMQVRTNDLDIEQFALRLIDSGSALEVDEQIVRKISGQADGICFIAKLQVDSIADAKTIDEARSILENGSNSIRAYDSLYQKVMARLVSQDERHKSIGVVSLCWLFSAKRLLSKQELLAALNFHFESQVPSVLDIVRSGCGLITHTPTIFKICHPTAEEYLKRTQDYWIRGHWTPHYGHIIARRLVETLSKEKFQICLHEAGLRKRFEHHPLYGYAAQNWGYHLQEQTGPDPVVIQFLQNGDLVSAAAQALEAASVTSTNFPEYLFTDMKITGMHLAAYFGLRESLKTLLQADPMGIDQEDINWRTPLSWAARYGQYHTASLLLTRGANVDAKDIDGKTPLLWAVEGGYKEIVGLYVTVVPLTLGGGPKIYNTGSENDPLLVAIKLGHDGIALMLLDAFLSDTVSTIDRYWDRGPFFAASRYGRAKVVEALLERGANPDITDDLGHTPLMEAARWGQIAAVKAILYFYSSTTSGYRLRQALSKTNNFGQSAWELANAEHHWHVSRLLLYYKESL